MSIDVVTLRNYRANENAIDVAFPVYAIECEVCAPFESQLDAYEEAVLKLVSIGLGANGIAKALNITLTLAEQIINKLDVEKLIERNGQERELTEDGKKYLIGVRESRPSSNSRFGYMFVSAIKRDILQYFYEGSIDKIARSDGRVAQNKLLLSTEDKTFLSADLPKRWRLEQAYRRYLRNLELEQRQEKEGLTIQEAKDAYADYESDFDEADYDKYSEDIINTESPDLDSVEPNNIRNSFVRPLKRSPEKLYLQMRIIISPQEPGGFTVESPLDLNGIDNEFFLRQVQWMKSAEQGVCLADDSLKKFLDREILKLSAQKPLGDKDKSIFILERLPLLSAEKDRYPQIYVDVGEIYELMSNMNSLYEKENIISQFNRRLLETLLNRLISTQDFHTRRMVKDSALSDIKTYGAETVVERIAQNASVYRDVIDGRIIRSAIEKLDRTLGNSITEKLINILTVYYYMSSSQIRRFIQQAGINDYVKILMRLSRIRNQVSHDTNAVISEKDYDYYIEHVFYGANRLFEALKESI